MADRMTPPSPSGGSGERRQAPSRPAGGYNERPQAPRSGSGYSGERPQAPRSGSGYNGERPQAPRSGSGYSGERSQAPRSGSGYSGERPQAPRSGSGYSGERPQTPRSGSGYSGGRPQAPRSGSGYSGGRPQAPRSGSGYSERRPASSSRSSAAAGGRSPRRTDVIRCENCGEDYSVTYKRCPFCDERPGRGGISGKRVANTRGGGYGRPVNPIQIAGLVVSLVLIASALFIVFRFVGGPLFGGGKKPPNGSDVSTSQSSSKPGGSSSQPNTSTPPAVQSVALNNAEVPLENGAAYQLVANLLPVGAAGEVAWSSSDATVAAVDANGLVTNLNAGSSDVTVIITASCGSASAQCSVTCKAKTGGGGSGSVASGSRGTIVNAEKGLNIRSGPGKQYEVVASAKNGASVTILGEENGYYKVKYSGEKTGYVSKDYVSVR